MDAAEEVSEVQFPAFPFNPYPIQLQFMRAVYAAIQKGGVAIVESPTGTGKTLSLICSVLQWLVDQHEKESSAATAQVKAEPARNNVDSEDEPDWMSNFNAENEQDKRQQKTGAKWVPKSTNISLCKERKPASSSILSFGGKGGVAKPINPEPVRVLDEVEQFVVEEYCSDEESFKVSKRKQQTDAQSSSSSDNETIVEEKYEPLKVFFCSRTHSQLSQFIGELQRTDFSSSLRAVSLGSRKNLCINSEVLRLGSSARINDRCLELQRDKQASKGGGNKIHVSGQKVQRKPRASKKCPMMGKQKLQRRFDEEAYKDVALDIEDLVELGSKLGTCPYYGSRRMVSTSDLVVLPYQSLLHSATRESLGINLKDSVVVIDEAHNLVDAVSNIHSCQVTESQLRQVNSQLLEYLGRFRKCLSANNRRYIEILLGIICSFLKSLATAVDSASAAAADVRMMSINDYVFSLEMDNLNLFKVRRYIEESNIVHKVSSYGEKLQMEQTTVELLPYPDNGEKTLKQNSTSFRASSTGFHTVADFLLALANADGDGRVLVTPSASGGRGVDGFLKFIVLNAAKHFADVLNQSRAVILAGGTLQPVEELQIRLFPHLHQDQLHSFCCGHIVPPESILPLAISRGPTNRTFHFTYQSRSCPLMMQELGRLMSNISTIIPEGIVVFLPSFEYERQVYNNWMSSTVLASIESRKTIFREPRDSASVESTLQQYRECISLPKVGKKTGAILLCVVGGKMSEGINFSDGMGRCVVMVGLPYPSPTDPELIERMHYIDNLSSPEGNRGGGQKAGKEYYENLCMKAVNQSIGRAIRHAGDYAAILLVDVRYTAGGEKAAGPASKLPGWIKERLVQVTGGFGEVHKQLHRFFLFNKTKHSQPQ